MHETASALTGHGCGDELLVRRAQGGDGAAFEQLFGRHRDGVYRLAVRLLGPDDADDAAQEAFVAAWRALPRFRHQSRFSTWLYRITVNQCHRVTRSQRPTVSLPDGLVGAGPGPADTAMLRSETERVVGALGHLADEQRTVLVLREFVGCSYEEIGGICDLSPAAVRSKLYRARTELVKALAKDPQESDA